MPVLAIIIAILILVFVLVKSADLIKTSLVSVSYGLNINYFISGFVLLSIASSLPEMSVGVTSASHDVPELSLGNLFGATLFLLTLTLGSLAIKHKSIPFKTMFGRAEIIASLALISLMVVVIADGRLSTFDGVILILAHLSLILYLIYKTKKKNDLKTTKVAISNRKLLTAMAKGAVGLVFLVLSSNLLVDLLERLSISLGIPELILGVLLLGVTTNLPELTVALTSKTGNQNKVAAGNVIGSAVMNVPILGLLGILSPFEIEAFSAVAPIAMILLLVCVLLGYFAWTDKKVVRWEGVVLVTLYVVMIAFQLLNII